MAWEQSLEASAFRRGSNHPNPHPIEKIPSFWKIKYTQEDLDSNRDYCEEHQYNRLHRLSGAHLLCRRRDNSSACL